MNRSLSAVCFPLIGLLASVAGCSPDGLADLSQDEDTASYDVDLENAPLQDDVGESDRRRRPTFASYSLYVAPDGNAARQAEEWRATDPDSAALMDELAAQPLALWIGDWTYDVTSTVDDAITVAGSELRTLVVYNIPYRDCGAWSAGGASDVAAYSAFIAEIADGIDGRPVIVVLEPDALALQTCLSSSQATERLALMAAAVDTLALAGASVYLDAGDSNWIGATEMAADLSAAGVARAAGFALNVSHTETTADSIGYAEELRAILGVGARYIVDTGRAGLGPTSDNQWCNPLERAIGERPSVTGRTTGLDGLLWIKPPGESDGECNGGPAAGAWWPEYALELADLGTAG